jgi:hypothetical protein
MADEIVGIIFSMVTIMVLGITYLKNRHRERLAMIQYGVNKLPHQKDRRNMALKLGLLLFSVGAGIFIGGTLDNLFNTAPQCTFSLIFIFSGLSLMYYHSNYITNKNEEPVTYQKRSFVEEDDDILI